MTCLHRLVLIQISRANIKKKINALHGDFYWLDFPPLSGDGCREEGGSDRDVEHEAPDNSKNKEYVKSKTEEAETAPLTGMFLCLFVCLFFIALFATDLLLFPILLVTWQR